MIEQGVQPITNKIPTSAIRGRRSDDMSLNILELHAENAGGTAVLSSAADEG